MEPQQRTYHASCPVCLHPVLRHKYMINDFTIVRCASCGLIFVREILSQEELDHYYRKDDAYLNVDDDCVYLSQDNINNLNYYFKSLRSLIVKRIPSGTILDIGCNAGYFLDVMGGFECYGIERSPSHAKVARQKHRDKIFTGTFEEYDPGETRFDCITLQDVFDHMVDPLDVLKKCHQLLKPQGLIVIKVHDMGSLYAKITGKNFYAFLPPLHLFYYNKVSLKIALEQASFELVDARHMAHLMYLSTVFYRLSKWDQQGLFYKTYKKLDGTWLGNMRIRKNLHDIITVFGIKKEVT